MSSTKTEDGKGAYWYWVLVASIAVVTVCGNALVIYLIAARQRLHTTPNWFVLSLSVADFCVGLIIAPTYIVYTFWLEVDFTVLVMFYNLLLYASVGNLCVMTFDRYIAITRPLRYVSLMKESMVRKLIASAWGVPIIITLTPLSWTHLASLSDSQKEFANRIYQGIVLVLFEIVPCIVMPLTFLHLFAIVKKQSRRIRTLEVQIVNRYNLNMLTNRRGRIRTHEKSVVHVFAIVVIIFEICWVLSAYRAFCRFNLCQVSLTLVQISRLFLFLNSAVNVCVYAVLKRDIREEMKKLLKYVRPSP